MPTPSARTRSHAIWPARPTRPSPSCSTPTPAGSCSATRAAPSLAQACWSGSCANSTDAPTSACAGASTGSASPPDHGSCHTLALLPTILGLLLGLVPADCVAEAFRDPDVVLGLGVDA